MAKDMQQLFKRVTEGRVQSVPNYSKDLNHIIKLCLQVQPHLRPTCAELLQKSQLIDNKPEKLELTNDD
jgi:NIMA (never in mitosis gene a)-related kinase